MSKRNWFVITTALPFAALTGVCAIQTAGCKKGNSDTPGVTAAEIKIGQSMPYSGAASSYGMIGKAEGAYFKMINEKGGINGRKLNLISQDDGYAPPKAVEQTRKLVENEGVAFIFGSVGTANNTAIQKYLNDKKVPQLFVATGADKWANPKDFPWTMGWQPSYRTEAKIYARYLMKEKAGAKLCVLYQNDDFGKDYTAGLQEALGDQYDKVVVKSASYEPTDPTVDSQIVTLQGAGCDTLLTAATPKFAAQSIRKVFDLGWKPVHFVSNVSVSIATVLKPAGFDKSTGIITGQYIKDINDPRMANDAGMNEYRAFMKQYMPDVDVTDANAAYGFAVAGTLVQVLTACGNDLTRTNIMKQAASLQKATSPALVEGIEITTSATDFRPIQQMRLAQFNGTSFEPMGELISGD
jgi:branched-chain amino acid transport system substrate-binding protein